MGFAERAAIVGVAETSDHFYRRHEKWLLLLLLPLCYALFFHQLGARDIWDPDEDEYVLVNREMVLDGHWIYPTANGGPYAIKPPLFNWLGSGISVLAGEVNELTSRLPSAIAASLGLVVLYLLARAMFGYRAAWLSVLVLATSPLYVQFARWIQINMLSTVLLTVTLACFWWGYTREAHRLRAYLLMYAAAGLGTLDMGPVNAVMPAVVIGTYLLAVRDVGHLRHMRIGWGILVYLAVAGPWYVAASLQEGYAEDLLIVTNFTRYFDEFHHTRHFFYYFETVPPYFLPWLVFLPGAFYLCFAERTRSDRNRLLLPFIWVVGLFLFFSISRTKRSEYMLPIFPALALLVGYALDWTLRQWEDGRLRARFFTRPLYLALGLGAVAAPVLAIVAATRSAEWLAITVPVSILSLVGCGASFLLARRERGMGAILALALTVVATVTYGAGPIVAKRNEDESVKPFCEKLKPFLRPRDELKAFRFYKPMYAVYTERQVKATTKLSKFEEWMGRKRAEYVVTEADRYEEIKDDFPHPLHVLLREEAGGREMVLLSNFSREELADAP
jgi:4-amino-4-deoxy-L-arabinose transferase-like glycosyltransferase